MTAAPRLIAHRGYRARYPENTLPALQAAIAAGARYVEFDVQLTADRVPVLLHDAELTRTAGQNANVLDLSANALAGVSVHEPQRLGPDFAPTPLPRLAEAVVLLNQTPWVTPFVEVKRHSVERFGCADTTTRVLRALASMVGPWVLISYVTEAIELGRAARGCPIGWVMRDYDDPARCTATALAPEYLFVEAQRLPADDSPLWDGPWQWVVYGVDDAAQALALAARGADFVETDDIGALLGDPLLGPPPQ